MSDLSQFSFRKLACIHGLISVRKLVRVELNCSAEGFSGYSTYNHRCSSGSGDHEKRWNHRGGAGRGLTWEARVQDPVGHHGSERKWFAGWRAKNIERKRWNIKRTCTQVQRFSILPAGSPQARCWQPSVLVKLLCGQQQKNLAALRCEWVEQWTGNRELLEKKKTSFLHWYCHTETTVTISSLVGAVECLPLCFLWFQQ